MLFFCVLQNGMFFGMGNLWNSPTQNALFLCFKMECSLEWGIFGIHPHKMLFFCASKWNVLWNGESLEFTHTKCSFLCASKWNVLWNGESLEFTHTKCSFLCASKWNVLWNGESSEFTHTKCSFFVCFKMECSLEWGIFGIHPHKKKLFFVLQNGTAGLLFDQQENRKRLAHDIFDTFAKYAGLVYEVTDVDWWAQNGSCQSFFCDFQVTVFNQRDQK